MNEKDMQELLDLAVNKLMRVSVSDVETVEVNQTQYDDGSVGFTVDLTFPAKTEQEKTKD